MSYHFTPTRKAVTKDQEYQAGENAEDWNSPTLLLGKVKQRSCSGNSLAVPQQVKVII